MPVVDGQKVLTKKRAEYMFNATKKELLIRELIGDLESSRRSAKRFVNSIGRQKGSIIHKKARREAEMATIAIRLLRRELHRERLKGVPVVSAPEEKDLYCKKCGYTVYEQGQAHIINYCPNCGRKLDWTGWV